VANIILPTWEALSDEVLARCLQSGTQNQNEAFNALIWQHAKNILSGSGGASSLFDSLLF